ncbi:hypothetical protein IVB27_19875 [Bradyrhizobium sp. 197]|uniref:hypothetical protein n=1 Tax=Bradyrhizobium sp. 197 TaxID=2782663 RepID=UPI001FFA1504|nr:hypothetical protein [Bradyrhizobium sp. 197]MCK1477006.1 hypothetical protein [Bradyrhizobium sp. 197]
MNYKEACSAIASTFREQVSTDPAHRGFWLHQIEEWSGAITKRKKPISPKQKPISPKHMRFARVGWFQNLQRKENKP